MFSRDLKTRCRRRSARADSADPPAVARLLESLPLAPGTLGNFTEGTMRVADHQFIQPLRVGVMAAADSAGVLKGAGCGCRSSRHLEPLPTTCRMVRWLREAVTACALGMLTACVPTAFAAVPVDTYAVVHSFPHDPTAFTEGLLYRDGVLFESTGLNGRSQVRKVELQSGRVLQKIDLPPEYFGEGLTDWGDELIGLTWQSRIGFVYDLRTFARKRSFDYLGEGWGLTHDNKVLFQSDGSSQLRVLDPLTLKELRRIAVTADGRPVARLNELEWVDGEIYANVWQTDFIARIDPATGHVLGWIDLTGLLESQGRVTGQVDVLNGIAYDVRGKRLFVTGKLWPALFEIRRVPQSVMRRSTPPA